METLEKSHPNYLVSLKVCGPEKLNPVGVFYIVPDIPWHSLWPFFSPTHGGAQGLDTFRQSLACKKVSKKKKKELYKNDGPHLYGDMIHKRRHSMTSSYFHPLKLGIGMSWS